MKTNDFWVPTNRRELLKWLKDYYKQKGRTTTLTTVDTNQLYAIYFRLRREKNN